MNFEDLDGPQIMQILEGEVAKALNEIRHAEDDLEKAESRLKFTLALVHNLKQRYKG
jgi:hypothetical protein